MTFSTSVLLVLVALGVSEISCAIIGDVQIGNGASINPSSTINALVGPIRIGDGLVIGANARIINRRAETLFIGNGNVLESGAAVEAIRVGDGNIFRANSFVGREVVIGNGITITAGCRITRPQRVADGQVVSGNQCM